MPQPSRNKFTVKRTFFSSFLGPLFNSDLWIIRRIFSVSSTSNLLGFTVIYLLGQAFLCPCCCRKIHFNGIMSHIHSALQVIPFHTGTDFFMMMAGQLPYGWPLSKLTALQMVMTVIWYDCQQVKKWHVSGALEHFVLFADHEQWQCIWAFLLSRTLLQKLPYLLAHWSACCNLVTLGTSSTVFAACRLQRLQNEGIIYI